MHDEGEHGRGNYFAAIGLGVVLWVLGRSGLDALRQLSLALTAPPTPH
jgi:hypothetical protein